MLASPGLDIIGDLWSGSANIAVVSTSCQAGNCLQVTTTGDYGLGAQSFSPTQGMLLKNSVYMKTGTESLDMTFAIHGVNGGGGTLINTPWLTLPSAWTQYTLYATADGSSASFWQVYQLATSGKTGFFDTASATQVLTPSSTGVTIVSTAGGSTYNWASINGSFNYNDPSGYTYSVDVPSAVYWATYTAQPNQVLVDSVPLTQNTTSNSSLTAGQWFLDTVNQRVWVYLPWRFSQQSHDGNQPEELNRSMFRQV